MIKIHELISLSDSKNLRDKLTNSIKFDIGEIDDLISLADLTSYTFFELPFDICSFQVCHKKTNTYLIFLAEDHKDGQITFALYIGVDGRWVNFPIWLVFDKPNKYTDNKYLFCFCNMETGIKLFVDEYDRHNPKLIPDHLKNWTNLLIEMASAIEVFSCSNVIKIEHKPSTALNKSRIKKKKTPFFSYHTLHINNNAYQPNNSKSLGNHASPRLHLRRGHIRRLHDGRRIWVTQCLVGDKSKGLVNKDYMVHAMPALKSNS